MNVRLMSVRLMNVSVSRESVAVDPLIAAMETRGERRNGPRPPITGPRPPITGPRPYITGPRPRGDVPAIAQGEGVTIRLEDFAQSYSHDFPK